MKTYEKKMTFVHTLIYLPFRVPDDKKEGNFLSAPNVTKPFHYGEKSGCATIFGGLVSDALN